MKRRITLEIFLLIDTEKLAAIHGDNWVDGAVESAREFMEDLEKSLKQHPFIEGMKLNDGFEV